MKYAIVIPDGCADEPQEELGGKTPLQAARTPHMDAITRQGIVGRSNNVPEHLTAGSAVANMSLLGYDVNSCFTGRAPLEAAAQGIELGPDDWAIRCNLVTLQDQIMRDFTADHISSAEAAELLESLQAELSQADGWATDPRRWEFKPGVSYRNLLIYRGASGDAPFSPTTSATPPHDLTDKSVEHDYPRGLGCDILYDIMSRSAKIFADHPVNVARQKAGHLPATHVWLWGLGKSPSLTSFQERFGVRGCMITAVDLLRGLASLVGWDRLEVPGATGYTDTDYTAKGEYAIDALPHTDLICVHVEATDEASHEGDLQAKIKALEAIDSQIVGPLHDALKQVGDYRILITPDHPTFLRTKTHSHGYVPWTMCGAGINAASANTYDEDSAAASSNCFDQGQDLMPFFLKT